MTKKKTQVALAPAIGYPLIGAAGLLTSKAIDKLTDKKDESAEERRIRMRDKTTDDTAKELQKMIDEETKKKRKGKQVKGTLTAKKGGLIKVRRGDGIAKRGKTKGRMI